MRKYIIMGPQGCGKGPQAQLLCKRLELVHISVGDVFRWNIQAHTKLAARIRRIVDSGALVPDEIVEEIVRGRLDEQIGITALPAPALPPVQSRLQSDPPSASGGECLRRVPGRVVAAVRRHRRGSGRPPGGIPREDRVHSGILPNKRAGAPGRRRPVR